MPFAIKAPVARKNAEMLEFPSEKTMYGGKHIVAGDVVFIFDSENEGGEGLIARGVVTAASALPKQPGPERQTPRVSATIRRTASAKRRLGRNELKSWTAWTDGTPQSELNFKFYRQATNKIAGITDATATFLESFFS